MHRLAQRLEDLQALERGDMSRAETGELTGQGLLGQLHIGESELLDPALAARAVGELQGSRNGRQRLDAHDPDFLDWRALGPRMSHPRSRWRRLDVTSPPRRLLGVVAACGK